MSDYTFVHVDAEIAELKEVRDALVEAAERLLWTIDKTGEPTIETLEALKDAIAGAGP